MNGPRIVAASSVVLIALFGVVVLAYGTDEAGLRTLVRATARASFGVFLVVYTASAARRLFPSPLTRWMSRNRRYLGLSFAVAHFLHLEAIWMLSLLLGDAFVLYPTTAVGGGIAYVLLTAMVLTSNDRAAAWLGLRRWNTLHRTGLHWIWFVFSFDWVTKSFGDPAYLPLAVLAFAGLGLRIAARRARSGSAPTVAATTA